MRSRVFPPERSSRRRRLALALAGAPALGAFGITRAADEPAKPAVGGPARRDDFDAGVPLGTSVDGKSWTVGDLPGRVLVVCFWAAWCPQCRAELPALERLQSAVSAEQLRVVLVNTEAASDWRRVSRQLEGKLKGLLTHDPDGAVRKAFTAPTSIPHTVMVGRDGRRRATLRGWSQESIDWLAEHADLALAEPPR